MRLPVIFLVAVVLSVPLDAAPDLALDQLSSLIRELTGEKSISAGAIVVVGPEGMVWEQAFESNVETGRRISPLAQFRVGAIGHSFVGLALARLAEEGKIGLEERVADVVPEFAPENPWEQRDPIRVFHLLEHAAGLPELGPKELTVEKADSGNWAGVISSRELMAANWKPGTYFAFSNVGPTLAAIVMERRTQRQFHRWLRQELFDPLGMNATGFEGLDEGLDPLPGHLPSGKAARPWRTAFTPSLGAVSSPADLAKFVMLLLGRGTYQGTQVISRESVERMETPSSAAARQGLQVGWGLGLAPFVEDGFVFLGYEGRVNGGWTAIRYLPREGLGYSLCINSGDEAAFRLLLAAANRAITAQLAPPQPLMADFPGARIAATAGYYRPLPTPAGPDYFLRRITGVVHVGWAGGKMSVGGLEGASGMIFPVTDRRFRAEGEPLPTILFGRDEDGRTVAQAFSPAWKGNYVRVSGMAVWGEWLLMSVHAGLYVAWLFLLIRHLVRRYRGSGRLKGEGILFVFPGLTLAISAFLVWLMLRASQDPDWALGDLTFISGGLFVGTILYAASAASALLVSLLKCRYPPDRLVVFYSLLYSSSVVLVTLYLVYWRVVAFRTWA